MLIWPLVERRSELKFSGRGLIVGNVRAIQFTEGLEAGTISNFSGMKMASGIVKQTGETSYD